MAFTSESLHIDRTAFHAHYARKVVAIKKTNKTRGLVIYVEQIHKYVS